MTSYTLSDEVRRKLNEVLLEDLDLIASLRQVQPKEDPARPGVFRCRCTVAVRRPLDPETSELREIDLLLRRTDEGFEAVELTGLEGLATQLGF
jgi:hypothetical protein